MEDIASRILSDPNVLERIAEKVYDRIKNEVIIKRLEMMEETLRVLVEETKNTNKRIEMQQEEIKKIWQSIEENTNAIRELQEQFNKMYERFERESKETRKEIERLRISFDSFTSRAGRYIERTIMEVFKEALVIHGIDPSKIEHGKIIDEVGIIKKGREYEVDFYETDGIIYIFEVKNFADEGALEQLEVRRKLFQAKYNKPVKAYLICNSIEKHVKEMMEKEGIIVITGHIIED